MQTVILVIHILICLAMIGVIMLQKSEGGALGIGGGGSGGGIMSGRGAAGALVRTTMIFAGVFFITSLALTRMANTGGDETAPESVLERGGLSGPSGDALDPLSGELFSTDDREAPPAGDPLEAAPSTTTPSDPLAAPVEQPAATGETANETPRPQ
ncbi:MAG: preprotein translocase subunit SecG [Pseudomonadota bacterium]